MGSERPMDYEPLECNPDGSYKEKQCSYIMGIKAGCYCVDRNTGVEVDCETPVVPTVPPQPTLPPVVPPVVPPVPPQPPIPPTTPCFAERARLTSPFIADANPPDCNQMDH